MKALSRSARKLGHGVRSLFSLLHDWDLVHETYGDNPNNIPEEERLRSHAVASNIINAGSVGM